MLPYSVSASSVNAASSALIKDLELLSCVPYLYTQKSPFFGSFPVFPGHCHIDGNDDKIRSDPCERRGKHNTAVTEDTTKNHRGTASCHTAA